ncbi:MAG: hypothetical protein SGBAC_009115 [Bacillariaceae sp.]
MGRPDGHPHFPFLNEMHSCDVDTEWQHILGAPKVPPRIRSKRAYRLLTLSVLILGCKCTSVDAFATPSTTTVKGQLNIAFVTGNAMKVREVEMILSEQSSTNGTHPEAGLVNLRVVNVDLPEIQEVNTEAIAKEKALLGAQLAGGPCLVEDTSLKFHALGGMPGPYIKWFQERLKSDGLYKILMAYEDKSATAVCTLAFCPAPHADPILFTGECAGTIVAPTGKGGFGWDSIFVPNGQEVTFSCLSTEQKNELSHRGDAVRQWVRWLSANQEALALRQDGVPAIGHKGLDFKSYSAEQ